MKSKYLLAFCSVWFVFTLTAQQPDSAAVVKLYNTSWTRTELYREAGVFGRLKRVVNQDVHRITFYPDEIQIAVNNNPAQICPHQLRNGNEFHTDCAGANKFIYRIMKIEGNEIVIDILAKQSGKKDFIRTSRSVYVRSRT